VRDLFAARGADVTVREIAQRAQVSVATLYRHFPNRRAMAEAAFTGEVSDCARRTEEALEDADPWRGLRTVVEEVVSLQISDRGFVAASLADFADPVDIADPRARALRNLRELVRRAQNTGYLRRDFTPSDLMLLVLASGSLASISPGGARRMAAYMLQSFAARTSALPSSAPISVLGVDFT
jgi:AcrR family transcriptional regulator